jgi:Mitochondrial calcium uniporter
MKEQSIIRTAAIMYADETQIVNIKTIHRKVIESAFVDNENKELNTHQIIDYIQTKLDLLFVEEEIKSIVNATKKNEFEVRFDNRTNESYVKLSQHRFDNLKSKEQKYSIQKFIHEFTAKVYKGGLSKETLEAALFKFIYELLNKNISAFKKITSSKCRAEEISINTTLFYIDERNAVNDFLNWDSPNKNKAIFSLVSYSVEYSLLSNNIRNSNILLQSIRKKIFYLDNNVIYRAIGINGEDRKNRVLTFLRKCRESGQEFVISKFTANEFKETIKHHIAQLQRVPFGKINPYLFRKYAVNPSIYEFYHVWRRERTTYGFDLFSGYIQGLYKTFIDQFGVKEDYRMPYNEKDGKVLESIANYKREIREYKGKGSDESHQFDAQNTFHVEQRRGTNNISIADTKFYFVSTDQKLRNWDFGRNDCQPLALLPSQWMTILLKYFSRTDDDFKSFVSFLKLKQEDPIISEDKLQIVLSGISEITEDFEKQSAFLERMVEVKFDGILNGRNIYEIRENAVQFSKAIYDKEIEDLKTNYSSEISLLKHSHDKTATQKMIEFKQELLSEVNESIKILQNTQTPLATIIQTRLRNHKWFLSMIVVGYAIIICLLIWKIGWDTMEPITYGLTLFGAVGAYLFLTITGKSFDPTKYFELKETEITERVYKEFNFDLERLTTQQQRKLELEEEIKILNKP